MVSALDVLALDEVSDGTFLTYVAALGLSGAILLVLAVLPLGTPILNRVIDAVIGVAMLGYGFYLFFIFDGGTFRSSGRSRLPRRRGPAGASRSGAGASTGWPKAAPEPRALPLGWRP